MDFRELFTTQFFSNLEIVSCFFNRRINGRNFHFVMARYLGIGPHLILTKTAQSSHNPIQPGDPFTYTITLANEGSGNAAGVVVSDTLPSHINGSDLYQRVDITAGKHLTFTLNVTLADLAPFGEVITNTAFFSHTSNNGKSSAGIKVAEDAGVPNLAITKTVHDRSNLRPQSRRLLRFARNDKFTAISPTLSSTIITNYQLPITNSPHHILHRQPAGLGEKAGNLGGEQGRSA